MSVDLRDFAGVCIRDRATGPHATDSVRVYPCRQAAEGGLLVLAPIKKTTHFDCEHSVWFVTQVPVVIWSYSLCAATDRALHDFRNSEVFRALVPSALSTESAKSVLVLDPKTHSLATPPEDAAEKTAFLKQWPCRHGSHGVPILSCCNTTTHGWLLGFFSQQ